MTKHRASSIGFIFILIVLFPIFSLVIGMIMVCELIKDEIKTEFNEEGLDRNDSEPNQ